jgi:hypothetical protein
VSQSQNLTNIIGNDWKENQYYDLAEKSLDGFWSKESIFYQRFQQLDCTNIVELACGHGRHVTRYLDKAKYIRICLKIIWTNNVYICYSGVMKNADMNALKMRIEAMAPMLNEYQRRRYLSVEAKSL